MSPTKPSILPAAAAFLFPALLLLALLLPVVSSAESSSMVSSAEPPLGVGRCRLSLSSGRIFVSGAPWISMGEPCLRRNGEEVCDTRMDAAALGFGDGDGDGPSGIARGRDGLGPYEESSRIFLGWEVAARRYLDDRGIDEIDERNDDDDGSTTTLIFEQRFLEDVRGASFPAMSVPESARGGLASRFPVFTPSFSSSSEDACAPPALGILRYSGNFLASSRVDRWSSAMPLSPLGDALDAGPVVLFTTECALVLSSASAFMSSGTAYDRSTNEMSFGVLGSVDSIPKGHSTSVIASSFPMGGGGPDAVRRALLSWGRKLRSLHGTDRRNFDVTLRNLQFSTDNGAFYYYNTERGMNYQETVRHVKDVAEERGLPFRSFLMDSWWYHKGIGGGVKNWTAMPSIFPDGIGRGVRDYVRWDILAHNRYFASDTDYARQNGGEYEFVVEGTMALPLEEKFWDDLFSDSKTWGLSAYEQDWLYTVSGHFNYTLRSVSAGRTWLVQMSDAAVRAGLPLQYCMPWARHLLQSVECDAVTQARASGDYQPGSDANWKVLGFSSILLDALGLAPTKDNFWSRSGAQDGSRYGDKTEHAPRLHAAVSSLSRGPVAPSDRIDLMDVDLVMRSCDTGGRLLRSDAPAVRTDASLLTEAGLLGSAVGHPYSVQDGSVRGAGISDAVRDSAQKGEVWSTYSALSGVRHTYILAAGTAAPLEIGPKDLYPNVCDTDTDTLLSTPSSLVTNEYVAWETDRPFAPLTLPLSVPPTTATDFKMYSFVPVFSSGWAFLGEAETKWIPLSSDRFSHLRLTKEGFAVEIRGHPGEEIRVIVRSPDGKFHRATCTMPPTGDAVLLSETMGCGGDGPRSPLRPGHDMLPAESK